MGNVLPEQLLSQLSFQVDRRASQRLASQLSVVALVAHLALSHVGVGFLRQRQQHRVHLRLQPVVGIHKANIIAGSCVQRRITRGKSSPVLRVQHPDPFV